jgi:cytochrome c556
VAAASLAAFAQQAPKPEAFIKARQSAFQLVGWNAGRIKASLDGAYNKDEVQRAAATIAAIANTNLVALFPPGSEQGKGWRDTTVKPELFKDPRHAADLNAEFTRQANELAKVAAAGEATQVKEQFAKLNRTCKACHDDFRAKD